MPVDTVPITAMGHADVINACLKSKASFEYEAACLLEWMSATPYKPEMTFSSNHNSHAYDVPTLKKDG
jgi:hypothetical protein